ncbi:uncharacterized protein METZ01_LOCUS397861, partial [marine metagenome]
MSDYETLQKLAYGLIAIMFVFYFVESLVIYKQELAGDNGSDGNMTLTTAPTV